MYFKILGKFILYLIGISFWPFLSYILPPSLNPYLPWIVLIQILLILKIVINLKTYLRYSKFQSFEDAKKYYYDLKRVTRLEKKAKIYALRKAKEEKLKNIRIKEEEKIKQKQNENKAYIDQLKTQLDERKKKVL
jgi:hypothetical protein